MAPVDDDIWAPHSSAIDWCEGNYEVSSLVAEFYNVVSNIPFVAVSLLSMRLYAPYARRCGPAVHAVFALLIAVGFGSAYFHATLSFAGQIIDELAILWVILVGAAEWIPPARIAAVGFPSRAAFRGVLAVVGLVGTAASFSLGRRASMLNAPLLLLAGFPLCYVAIVEVRALGSRLPPETRGLSRNCALLFLAAVACWAIDRLVCPVPLQLHAAWHVLVYFASHGAVAVGCCMDAHTRRVDGTLSRGTAAVRYWPRAAGRLGLPYVVLVDDKR